MSASGDLVWHTLLASDFIVMQRSTLAVDSAGSVFATMMYGNWQLGYTADIYNAGAFSSPVITLPNMNHSVTITVKFTSGGAYAMVLRMHGPINLGSQDPNGIHIDSSNNVRTP
jgi:hypothetical protein